MSTVSQATPPQDAPPAPVSQEGARGYFYSSAELKDGLDVCELSSDKLPLAFRQALNLV